MADLDNSTDTDLVTVKAVGSKLLDKPSNSLNKSSRKVGIKNPKQKQAVAIKLNAKKFATGKI